MKLLDRVFERSFRQATGGADQERLLGVCVDIVSEEKRVLGGYRRNSASRVDLVDSERGMVENWLGKEPAIMAMPKIRFLGRKVQSAQLV